jgi:hypothetical protein
MVGGEGISERIDEIEAGEIRQGESMQREGE